MPKKQFNLQEERTLLYERLDGFFKNYSLLQFDRCLRLLLVNANDGKIKANLGADFHRFHDGLQEWLGILEVAINIENKRSSFDEDEEED